MCSITLALVRVLLATDFFAFVLARGLVVLALLPEPVLEGADFLAVFPTLGLLSFIRRVDAVAFDTARDAAFFLLAALASGLPGFFLDFASEDFFAGILTSYPYARNGATPEQAA